ncbi:MAG: molybdopterin dehydrogenase FAD-binding protein [Xanthobacteraceae bacterium]|jgi:xanthine dehydrogenase YagS FAD-binding subunit|nr:molybdopterin dehydrogenase FAD-binding protein [Xanthobacteraceae bacterium]
MQPFSYQRSGDARAAVRAATRAGAAPPTEAPIQFIAGGTNMTDYMKLGVARPEVLIDINELGRQDYGRIELEEGGLRLGALVRMAEAQEHPKILADYPVVAQTLALAASQQIRNMASLGGNVLQRTRCEYFRGTAFPCNKRNPGSGCAALQGINREHAVLGTSEACIATYHGDFAQALIALDATVETLGPGGRRQFRFSDLHRLPGETPNIETNLEPGELITFIRVPAGPHTRRSHYVKIRDRESYQFAVASAAVALDLDGDTVRDARIALGGLATVPWRAREAEAALRGKALDEEAALAAAEIAFAPAKPREHNAFKVAAGKQTLVRALLETRAMQI